MIRRIMMTGVVVFSCLLVAGCSGMTITEKQINQAVTKEIAQGKQNHVQIELNGSGTLDMDLLVEKATVDLTKKDGGLALVTLKSKLSGTVNAFGQNFTFSTDVTPSFESGVRLEEDRLYLVAPKITSIEVYGSNFSDQMLRSTMGSLHGDFEKALADYFNKHPIYVLNHSIEEKLAAKMIKKITINEDAVELGIF